MPIAFSRLFGIVRYELKMQWRRRGLLVVMAGLATLLLLSNVLLGPAIRQAYIYVGPESERPRITPAAASFTWMAATLLLTLALPLVVSETIPLDRQTGVRELLDSLPPGRGVYLTGKVVSVWAGLLIGMAGAALLDGLIGRPFHGPESPGSYFALWVFGLAPLALFISGVSVLLAAGQPTRRRATFVGALIAVYVLASPRLASGMRWSLASLIQPAFVIARQSSIVQGIVSADLGFSPEVTTPISLVVTTGAVQIGLAWLLMWGWLRWKEGR